MTSLLAAYKKMFIILQDLMVYSCFGFYCLSKLLVPENVYLRLALLKGQLSIHMWHKFSMNTLFIKVKLNLPKNLQNEATNFKSEELAFLKKMRRKLMYRFVSEQAGQTNVRTNECRLWLWQAKSFNDYLICYVTIIIADEFESLVFYKTKTFVRSSFFAAPINLGVR